VTWVTLEVTVNAWAIAWIVEPHVARVIVVSPNDTGIRQARAMTDRSMPEAGAVRRQAQRPGPSTRPGEHVAALFVFVVDAGRREFAPCGRSLASARDPWREAGPDQASPQRRDSDD
jgi:hypothetical protein